jgi:hypothetical protein
MDEVADNTARILAVPALYACNVRRVTAFFNPAESLRGEHDNAAASVRG